MFPGHELCSTTFITTCPASIFASGKVEEHQLFTIISHCSVINSFCLIRKIHPCSTNMIQTLGLHHFWHWSKQYKGIWVSYIALWLLQGAYLILCALYGVHCNNGDSSYISNICSSCKFRIVLLSFFCKLCSCRQRMLCLWSKKSINQWQLA